MDRVISTGRIMMMERQWPQETSESLKTGCSGVENRWKWVWSEAEDWGRLLEAVLPEMDKFQVRRTQVFVTAHKIMEDMPHRTDLMDSGGSSSSRSSRR